MRWIKERQDVLQAGIGPRRYVYASIFLAVIAISKWLVGQAREHGITALADIPVWTVGVIVLLIATAYWLLEYAVHLRRQLAPKLSLSFNPERGSIVTTPLKDKVKMKLADQEFVQEMNERRGVYIRGLVTAVSEKTVSQCTPYLVGVRKKHAATGMFTDTQYLDDLQLPWSLIGERDISIPQGVRRYFDVVTIDEKVMQPRIASQWPLTLRNLFDDKTTYQLDLMVSGEGITVKMTIEFTWTGDLKNVAGQQIS